ncbi:Tyrosine decarboxylase 1 [Phytophthora cinnamomi]|uniref:Tyrosine decarboxylase 1 n=1 Tax=Phytophthora cinnamomi TaxID=4785 RepID=UPI00355AA706|nr:Tyrosine decarboxylase 1 [Phytophthora cinnamomi]
MHDSTSTAAAFCSGLVGGAALLAAFQHLARRRALESTRPLDVQDPEAIRHPAAALTELLVRYHENLQRRDPQRGEAGSSSYPVRSQVKPGQLVAQLPSECPEDPQSYADIFRDVEQLIFPALTHWASPSFHAYFKICGSDPSVLADYLCSSLDVVGFSWVAAPAATELEQVVCDWMAKLLGLPESFLTSSPGGGVIQGSASEAALCALIAARNQALAGLEGIAREEKADRLVLYVSDQTHAIAEKGCMVLDLPHLRVVPTVRGKADTDNYGLAPDDVARAMAEDRAKGLPEHVWVHLDGAYGGAAAVCPEYQHWLDGAEGCDSICVNTHKWLLVSFDASLLWVKDRRPLVQALALDPEYLKNDFMQSAPNYKDWQVPLGRRFRALKLWFTFRRFGATGLREHIRHSVALAKQAEELLTKDRRFKLFVKARMGLVCFYVAFGGREINEALLRRVNESGKAFLIHSVVDGVHFLRLAIGGLEVDTWHIENVVSLLSKALTEVIDENPKWHELQRATLR